MLLFRQLEAMGLFGEVSLQTSLSLKQAMSLIKLVTYRRSIRWRCGVRSLCPVLPSEGTQSTSEYFAGQSAQISLLNSDALQTPWQADLIQQIL